MKTLLPCLFILPLFAFADQGLLLNHLTDVRYSPQFKIYAVITFQPEKSNLLTHTRQRVQVFDTETGNLMWSTTHKISVIASDIHPADDGEHIVVVRNGVQRLLYENNNTLTGEMRDEIENETVLVFHKRDKELKSYTVKDLGLKAETVFRSVSRFSAFKQDRPPEFIGMEISRTLAKRNPLILNDFMRLFTAKGETLYFDIKTGAMLKEAPEVFKTIDPNPSIPTDPFGNPVPEPSSPPEKSAPGTQMDSDPFTDFKSSQPAHLK